MEKHKGMALMKSNLFGKSLRDPILGKHFKLPGQSDIEKTVKLDTSLPYIPVYAHLKVHDAELLERPSTPPVIKRIEKEEYMEFHTSPNKKTNETITTDMVSSKKSDFKTPSPLTKSKQV